MKPNFLHNGADKLTRSIEGSLSLMPLADLIQWIETAKRSGTLIVTNEDITRRFYFQGGTLIFVWSDLEGERFCDTIIQETGISMTRLQEAMNQSEQLGISFMGLLSSDDGVSLQRLTAVMSGLTEQSLSNSLTWKTGNFRFNDHVPPAVLCSPVTLRPSQVLLDSAVQFDEGNLESQVSLDPVMNEVYDLIRKGAIDLPPLPTEMQVLMNKINEPDLNIEDIIDCINDPLLVSKVLRVCNSSFYGHRGKVDTMRDAVVYMGLKSLMSIVTVHALSGFSPHNADQVQKILHHSMMVGMIAKQLAKDMGVNHEQAFVCGLLHDLGWIVMIEILAGYDLSQEKRDGLMRAHHSTVGGLVAKKWNFSEEIQEVIRHHHDPINAHDHAKLVEIIYLADLMAKNEAPPPDSAVTSISTAEFNEFAAPFGDHLEELDREIEAILAPMP